MNFALMVIDLQKAYYREATKDSMDTACEYINAVLPLFRKRGSPILWVQHMDEEDGVVPGKEGFELLDALKPEPAEPRIRKAYGNSFNRTDCARILAESRPDLVVLTGYCAEHCVLSTYRGAQDLDLLPVILRNGIASGSRKNQEFVERISNVISYGVLRKLLESAS